MHRFFIQPQSVSDGIVFITGIEAHHLTNVLRLRAGETVELYDGSGSVYQARIEQLEANGRVRAALFAVAEETEAAAPALYLGQALLKGKKMDFVVQKATELGVAGLLPFVSKHCINRQHPETREGRRQERWARIIAEACKQCGRPVPPCCQEVSSLDGLLTDVADSYDAKLIFWEGERTGHLDELWEKAAVPAAKNAGLRRVLILIGPEGGFSEDEVVKAREAGFQAVTLGRRVLRAETASLAAVAIVQHLLGNLR